MLHVVSLAQYATVYTRSWAADSTNQRVRLKAEKDRAEQEPAMLREEIRIKDSRIPNERVVLFGPLSVHAIPLAALRPVFIRN